MRQELKARPVVLCILDGWGHREDPADNAIRQAATPCLDRLLAERPWSLIDASELAVGLPSGQMGNSEVGHMNLGAGRVVMQDLPRIDQAVAEKAIPEIESYKAFVTAVKGGTGLRGENRGQDRNRQRALLRHGPGQALGPGGAGLRLSRGRQGRGGR